MINAIDLIIIIWLIGTIPAYIKHKNYMTKDGLTWTTDMRLFAVFISIVFSWIMIPGIMFTEFLTEREDKPASW